MKRLFFLFLLILISTLFSSCIDYNDTSSKSNDPSNDLSYFIEVSDDNSSIHEKSKLIVNEISPINTVSVKDKNGTYSSWIEIKNVSNVNVKLSEYTISIKSSKNETSFSLEDIILTPNELYLVVLNDYINKDDSFYFSSSGTVTISSSISNYSFYFDGAKPNYSYTENQEMFLITPGYETPKAADNLLINEVMSSNKTFFKQEFCDWIEIYNFSENTISLSNYFISDDEDDLYKSRLPDVKISPKEYYVLVFDDSIVNFNISSKGESLFLTRDDGVSAHSIIIPQLIEDSSYTVEGIILEFPTPGFANDYNGHIEYRKTLNSKIVINEVMSSNLSFSPLNRRYYDWIELKNVSDETINLSDYYLSNKDNEPTKYILPNKNLPPNDTIIIYATGNGGDQCNFKISSDIEHIYLFDKNQCCVDSILTKNIPVNKSFGRYNNELVYFNNPTPNKDNSFGYSKLSGTPVASISSGIYNNPIVVKLDADGDIYYTLDGSEPTKKSYKYSGEGIIVSQNTSLRVVNFNGDHIPSDVVTYNYFIDIPSYSLPILKITTTEEDFYGNNGLYTNYEKNIEKKINLAFYVDGVEEFNLDCGLSIAGQGSRILPKKSMEVKFKSEYGASKLKYDMFGSEMQEFDTLMLRGGSEDQNRSLFRDEFFTSLVGESEDMTVWVQDYRPCNLYINDEYFGIYFIRERLNDHYYASYLNTEEKNLDVIYYWHANEYGTMNEWKKIYNFCENNDLRVESNYRYVENLIDVDNWIDYYIARAYTGDKDLANIRLFYEKGGNGKWRIVLFDLDWSFTISKDSFYTHFGKLTKKTNNDSTIIYNLLKNEEFKDRFLKRLSMHLNNTLTEENVLNHLQFMKDSIEPDIKYEIDRWKQLSLNSWNKSINSISNFIDDGKKTRTEELLENIQITLNLSDAEMNIYFSGLR